MSRSRKYLGYLLAAIGLVLTVVSVVEYFSGLEDLSLVVDEATFFLGVASIIIGLYYAWKNEK
jgi:uncharacterized membrane protein HdeD (DUF308 family)